MGYTLLLCESLAYTMVYNTENGLKFVSPTFNQDVLLQYWPIVVIMIVFEIGISLYKLVQGKWTQRLAIGNAILQVAGTIVFIVIVVNPHLFNTGFITYLANAFTISTEEFKTWLIGEEFSSIRYLLQ